MVTEMADFLKGGAKGEPGKTSSGIRGGEDIINKATRPFGGLHVPSTTAMPFAIF